MQTILMDEVTSIRTRQELFSWLANRARISGGSRLIPKALVALFDEIMTALGENGKWTRRGSRGEFGSAIAESMSDSDLLCCGMGLPRLLNDFARHCVERDGCCELNPFAAIRDALEVSDSSEAADLAEITYELLVGRLRLTTDGRFNETETVNIDVWLDIPNPGEVVLYRHEDDPNPNRVRLGDIYPPRSSSRQRQ